MNSINQRKVIFTGRGRAELISEPAALDAGRGQLAGRTLVSVVSSGSETGGFMDYFGGTTYPCPTGYAVVMLVTNVGEDVRGFAPGDVVFAEAPHQALQVVDAARAVKVPEGMDPEHAVLSRFPAVSMTTMIETRVRPTEPVLVSGLGIVGLMCAQVMRRCGYPVYAVDPVPSRRETAARCGVERTFQSTDDLKDMKGSFGLGLECSGNDNATLGMLDLIRKGGELSLIGVPWRQTSDVSAHEVFRRIFSGYVRVRSGWEWSLPRQSQDFLPNSTAHSFETAMRWIEDGGIRVDGIYKKFRPEDCAALYPDIAAGRLDATCAMFDWR